MKFTKTHGAGNDFVVLMDYIVDADKARAIANRKFGVGCDQVICCTKLDSALGSICEDGEVYKVAIFNADGSRSLVCGNAFRCLADMLGDVVLITVDDEVNESSGDLTKPIGSSIRYFRISDGKVNMGTPSFYWGDVPMARYVQYAEIDGMLGVPVSMGNPHLIYDLTVGDVESIDIARIAQVTDDMLLFPYGVNISVVDFINNKARVWERGVGETLSCGSAACATFAVGCKLGKFNSNELKLSFPGGILDITANDDGSLMLSGETCISIFTGYLH